MRPLVPIVFGVALATVATSQAQQDPTPWWSLAPLGDAAVPAVPADRAAWVREPLDRFVLARLLAAGLEPAPEADRRTLLRRLHVDLVGLPPTPEEVQAFVADLRPDAYEREVDRLLASERYGERQARAWLDVVHYADTHGYDKDKPRRNAWPYRDWVIRAFDEDLPWSRFVALQVAGDVLPDARGGDVAAVGMLAAGPWDFVGHVELAEGTVEKAKTRSLDRDDVVTNVFGAFQSLTVQCARCHDHKFDPVTQAEYYDLQAVFAGVERAERDFDPDPAVAEARRSAQARSTRGREALARLDAVLDARVAAADDTGLRAVRDARTDAAAHLPAPDRTQALGWHSAIESAPDRAKWVELDLGVDGPVTRVVVYPCDEAFGGHPGPGFGLPPVLEVQLADATAEPRVVVATWARATAGPRDGDAPLVFDLPAGTHARFVRVTAPTLWERTADYCMALAEVEVFDGATNRAHGATVTALDSIEAGERWGRRFVVDGVRPWSDVHARLAALDARITAARDALETPDERAARAMARHDVAAAAAALAGLPPRARVYAVTDRFRPEGAFTPPPDGRPRPVFRLHRGDVTQAREPSVPGALATIAGVPASFDLPADHDEGARRIALAHWLTRPDNPLTWRSAVNRVWQGHFGRGLVATSSDFGHMGELPSHPEVLDYLARSFRDGGGSVKALHRTIVCSATYRQASTCLPVAADIDGDNRLLSHAPRRRLEAEAIRDAILQVSGCLDLRRGGPGFELFAFEDDHSPRYRYDAYDVDDPATFRRSIYRFVVRSVPDPWMTVFDCADPSVCTAVRMETTTPLQALGLLNDAFLLRQAEHFAARLERDGGDPIERAVQLVWQRAPRADEHRQLAEHAARFGLPAVCRVLLNSSEFVHVD